MTMDETWPPTTTVASAWAPSWTQVVKSRKGYRATPAAGVTLTASDTAAAIHNIQPAWTRRAETGGTPLTVHESRRAAPYRARPQPPAPFRRGMSAGGRNGGVTSSDV